MSMKPRFAFALAFVLVVAASVARGQNPPPGESTAVATAAAAPAPSSSPQPGDWRDPAEGAGKRLLFIGLRYRGTIVPQFLMNAFVDEGRSVYSNTVGVELDVRKDRFSLVPHLAYTDYAMDDTLFHNQGESRDAVGEWSYSRSSLKALYFGIDLLWSARLHRMLDFEFGLGVGVAYVFGDLVVNWVYKDMNGRFLSSDGQRFSGCRTQADGPGCATADHTGADTAKVGGYIEKNWISGGPIPSFFARISLPILGLRWKPVRDVEMRVQAGWSLTEGPCFGLSANYRLPTR
jgi:hypothetical protein